MPNNTDSNVKNIETNNINQTQHTTSNIDDDQKQALQTNNASDTTETKALNDVIFAVAQSNFCVGELYENVLKMQRLAKKARSQGADIIIFPEMALLGYPSEDLLRHPNLPQRVKSALNQLSEIKDIVMIVGYPHIDHHGIFNSIAILHNGQQKGFYHKQYLANYGVFDERRYFNKGRNQVLFDFKGVTIGLLISEDLWEEEPIKLLKEQGADIIVSINASPFEINKQINRKKLLSERAKHYQLPIIYANAIGGQDDLVFDGGSMMLQSSGDIAQEAPRFLQNLLIGSFNKNNHHFNTQSKSALTLSEEAEMYQALVVGLRDYVNNSGFQGVIVGLSGGIDSALTLAIAVDALGSDKVYAVMMPYQYTSPVSLEDAETQARRLNVSYTVCPIHDAVEGIRSTLAPLFNNAREDSTEENIQARARGTILMALSNKFGHLVINTTNKSELAIGTVTLYGDMAGGFAVLKDVYKTQIYKLANYRNRLEDDPVIPERVIARAPSAELRPEQTDQDTLPNYDILDAILVHYIDEGLSYQEIIEKGLEAELVERLIQMVDSNEYKRRQIAIGTKISHKAFDRERRYPLVNGWKIKSTFDA